MLILQRKVGESLAIGDEITVSVVSIDGTRVRLAISAPDHVPILRSELIKVAATNQDSVVNTESLGEFLDALRNALPPDAPSNRDKS